MLGILYLFFYFSGHTYRPSDLETINQLAFREASFLNIPSDSVLFRQEENRMKLEWSKFIHSELQPYLLAIDISEKQVNQELITTHLKSKILEFKKELKFFGEPEKRNLIDVFTKLNSSWEGIISIVPSVDLTLVVNMLKHQAILDISDVLGELALNSVKHGGADLLEINIEVAQDNTVVIRGENNGSRLSKAKPGFGSSIFDEVCGKNWSLRNYGEKVVFTCRISNN
jgi:hypothetical protein